jgi:hypothetical protein
MSDIYLSLTETPSVVTLSQPVVSGVLSSNVTVTNVVSVNVVTMPAINVTAAGGLTNAELRASAVSVAVTTMPALSISSVSISNFPASQTIAGTVTANVDNGTILFVESVMDGDGNTFGIDRDFPISGTVTANPASINWNTIRLSYATEPKYDGIYYNYAVNPLTTGFYLNEDFGGNGHYFFYGHDNYGLAPTFSGNRWYFQTADGINIFYASSTTTNLSAVTGWVDINGANAPVSIIPYSRLPVAVRFPSSYSLSAANLATVTIGVRGTVTVGNSVTIGSIPAISGTVTVGGFSSVSVGSGAILAAGLRSGVITPIPLDTGSGRVAGSAVVQYNVGGPTPYQDVTSSFPLPVQVVSQGSVSVGQLPRVTFIDGSGTVTTANSAITVFASSTTRSYLLVQVTTGSAFVNVGATATTVNGINLTAGQGYAWETTIPQGLVSLISTTTSSRWVAKEA